MKKHTKITKKDLEALTLCAFRYALGRQTYITKDISKLIFKYMPDLDAAVLMMMLVEINMAIHTGKAGADCDIKIWQNLERDIAEELANRKEEI